jgi:hypothetical protein
MKWKIPRQGLCPSIIDRKNFKNGRDFISAVHVGNEDSLPKVDSISFFLYVLG